jgi:hypothetical protein
MFGVRAIMRKAYFLGELSYSLPVLCATFAHEWARIVQIRHKFANYLYFRHRYLAFIHSYFNTPILVFFGLTLLVKI